jgi:hypothetical protein
MDIARAQPTAPTAPTAPPGVMSSVMAKRGAVVVFVVLTTLLIVLVIAYIVWRINVSKLTVTDAMKNPRKLYGRPALRVSASKLAPVSAGQGYAISFWLYLVDYQPTALPQLLLLRQGNGGTGAADLVANASPVVFLAPSANRMYVAARTNAPPPALASGSLADVVAPGNRSRLVATIDYVPLQRWINVIACVQDSLMSVYMDGSLYSVASLDTLASPRPMFAMSTGDLVVGNINSSVSADAQGFMSNVQLFNYPLSVREALRVYQRGPLASTAMLGALGLSSYGVRSPVYRLDDSTADGGDGSDGSDGSDGRWQPSS